MARKKKKPKGLDAKDLIQLITVLTNLVIAIINLVIALHK